MGYRRDITKISKGGIFMARTIVSVQYRKKDSEEYGGRPYSYYTELPLKTGDLVVAPTKWGASPAKVAEVDIPWSRIGEQI